MTVRVSLGDPRRAFRRLDQELSHELFHPFGLCQRGLRPECAVAQHRTPGSGTIDDSGISCRAEYYFQHRPRAVPEVTSAPPTSGRMFFPELLTCRRLRLKSR